MFLYETFHTSDTFDNALENIAKKIVIYSKALYSKEGWQWLKQNVGKYSYTNYNIRFTNDKYELIKYTNNNDLLDDDIPIFIKLCSEFDRYWMLSIKREFIENVESMIIYCNSAQLFNKYRSETGKDCDEAAYTKDFKAKISHELNGHAIQYLYNPNMQHVEHKIDELDADIKNKIIDNDSCDMVKRFFYFMHPLEIEARINEIYTLFKEKGLVIIDQIYNNEPAICKPPISIDLLRNILVYIDKNTKLTEISTCVKYIYEHDLNNIMNALNKKYKVYKENTINDTVNAYRIKIFRQLYRVLTEELEYDGINYFELSEIPIKNADDIPDSYLDIYECYNPFGRP